ncbi:gamma-glutamyltransferase, partial [Candidatus Bathyarchaeota archaeon]|nr:gamma-glutamyltransferase [Candidatus Bathyarchaeota archaeon]
MNVNFRIEDFFSSRSRRSPVLSTRGIVASSQPLATQAGIEILMKGGNAADAAVACAAALNVTEPMSTGIGGDCFALFYDSTTGQVKGINGSGRAPRNLSMDVIIEEGITGSRLPATSPHAITVPGAVAGWVDTVNEFGKLGMEEILSPAIRMARDGHP